MSGVFLSYRRDDTGEDARRIHDRLAQRFGDDLVYIDVEDIPLGVNFMDHITSALKDASYVLIAIGPRWLLLTDDQGHQRLQNPEDPVRYEIRTALKNKRMVVPMLIGNATMPTTRNLPSDISGLVLHNGIAIRPDPDFEDDIAALMDGLRLDRIVESRVPTVFRVGLVARNLGYGGAVGWGVAGVVLAFLTNPEYGLPYILASAAIGVLAGWLGGWVVGSLTGLLIRHKSPPLVTRQVRRMGLGWSFGIVLTVVVAVGIGLLVANRVIEDAGSSTDGFGEAIGEVIGAFLIALLLIMFISFMGLIVGSGLAAAYFARRLRLGSDQISRWRAIVIGLVWMMGGLFTGIGFLLGVAYVAELAGRGWAF